MSDLARTFSALGDATRFAIVEQLLQKGEQCAGDLLGVADISAPAISRHLKVLREAGVKEVFHKVRLRPGKPLWFGVCDRRVDGRTRRTLVFGCPGNPVSTFVTFHKFVRPALASLTGCTNDRANVETGRLTHAFATRGERAILYPARWSSDADGQIRVTLLDWRGSADIFTLTQANCLSVFPPGARQYAEGEAVQYERI